MRQCPALIKYPPAEYNRVIDHLVSSLKSCVSSHSFNKGKMSTVYRPEKMDYFIFCHWLWDVYEETERDSQVPLRILYPAIADWDCLCSTMEFLSTLVLYTATLDHLTPSAIFMTSRHCRAMRVNCNCTSLLLCHNYSCDSAQGENDLIVSG